MPIYEYRCENGHTFEVLQRMTDDPVATCEACSAPVQRVFHPVAVHFKGSGFYNTDYGTRKRAREKSSDSSASTPASSDGASSSGDSAKPAESSSTSDSSSKPDASATKKNAA
jgi:putative FmdB family regulatory protein